MDTNHSVKYAGFWRRFGAYFIDFLIVSLFSFIKLSLGTFELGNGVHIQLNITNVIVGIIYFTYFWTRPSGQTLGDKLLGIKVIKENGSVLSFGGALIRYIGYLVSGLPLGLGFLWMLWDAKRQGWQDKMAGTIVVMADKQVKLVAERVENPQQAS